MIANDERLALMVNKRECEEIANFIDWYLFKTIREDEEIDNIEWVRCMIELYDKSNELRKKFKE